MAKTSSQRTVESGSLELDVVVIGAGCGGLYAVHRFTEQGLKVRAIDGASGVGGVWHHNAYPGARVDVDSIDYSYHFSDELLEKWTWTERFAAQPELKAYFEFVADMFDLNDKILLNTWVTSAVWDPQRARYDLETSTGARFSCRFLVMATGNLTMPRKPAFAGLDRFRGRWVQTSRWPDDVDYAGKRVAILGTGSSGVQAVPVIAEAAEHLYVFQRTPHYAIPARNRPLSREDQDDPRSAKEIQEFLLTETPGGTRMPAPGGPAPQYTPEENRARLETQWAFGGQGILFQFLDQSRNTETSELVSDFAREKIRAKVGPERAGTLVPDVYPLGVRRVANEIGYYDAFERDNVSLIDLRKDPFVEITETGIRTQNGQFDVDLIVFAIGFDAFTAAIDGTGVRNELGEKPTDKWARGPRTMLGLMTRGFPNMFCPTGAGSPSVIANLIVQNEFAIDWIADLIAYMDSHGHRSVNPSEQAVDEWTAHCAEVSELMIRRRHDNYMVKVNDDGSRIFIPYAGGLPAYVNKCREIAAKDYEGFEFG